MGLAYPNPNSPCASTWIRVGPSSRALQFIIIKPKTLEKISIGITDPNPKVPLKPKP